MNFQRIRSHLERVHGLGLFIEEHPGAGHRGIQVWPDDLHRNEGFCVEVEVGWRSVTGRLMMGAFASEMILVMGEAPSENREVASSFLRTLKERRHSVTLKINGAVVSPEQPSEWAQAHWHEVDASTRQGMLVPEDLAESDIENVVSEAAIGLLGFMLALAPTAERSDAEPVPGLPEGARTTVVATRYERSRINRAACLAAHGFGCQACGVSLSAKYGGVADELVHVHHVTPLSQLGADYQLDPVRDLVPLCPNCHAVAHRRDPPHSVAEIRSFLAGHTGY